MNYQAEQKKSQAVPGAGKTPPFFGGAVVQPKLTVNRPGDRYEQEADEMADKVVNMRESPDAAIQPNPTAGIQRKCAHCEEEEKELQLKPDGGHVGRAVSPQLTRSLQASKGNGKPLPGDARSFMESRFGTDFSDVNIHTGSKAVQFNRSLHAQAFTHGRDIYFNEGKFAPNSNAGKRLLAHELTHVIQQTSGAGSQNQVIQKQEEAGQPETSVVERASMALLDTILPVGSGFYFEVNGGITWGYPIYTGGSAIIYVSRASQSQVHILVRKQGRLAFDTGVGGSVMLGRQRSRGGGGRNGLGIGAEAGANFMAGVLGTVVEEYAIPVEAFLMFVGAQAVGATLSANRATSILSGPVKNLLGQDADQYMTRQQVEGGLFATADAEAGVGVRRSTNSFNERGEGPGGNMQLRGSTWGHGDDRDAQGRSSDVDPVLRMTRFLGIFLSANVSAQLIGGFEQQTAGNTETYAVYLEGQLGAMIGLPIPVVSQVLSTLPPDAAGGVRLEFVQTPGEPMQIRAIVYLKQGEDQYYAGTAGQQNMVFDLTNIISVEELAEAFRQGRLPSISGVSFGGLLEKVSFFNRLMVGGPSRLFGRFLNRQAGTRSLLSKVAGGELEIYLDYAGDMDGPDFIRVAERLLSAGGQAVNSVSGAQDFSSAYEQLSQFFSGYIDSEEFSGLTDDLLDQLAITTAKLRLQAGGGGGIAARLAEGAKVRGDISVVGGMSCEVDLAAMLGGRISLRTVLEGVGDVIDNPLQYLPDCPILRPFYDSGGGGTAAGPAEGQGTAGGSSSGPEAVQEAAGRARETAPPHSQGEDRQQASASRSSSGEYHVSNRYPEVTRPVDLQILNVYGDLRLDTAVNTELRLRFIMMTDHVGGAFPVSVNVKVVEISDTRIVLELMESWWIEELSVGSRRGVLYTLTIPDE